jgi:peroxiredoxin Q/BCP
MAQLRQDYPEFVRRITEVIAIGPEDPLSFARWWKEHDMPFVGLADPDHSVADLFGQEVSVVKLGRMPAQFLIDRRGRVRYRHHSSTMCDLPANREILQLLDHINQETR